MESLSNKVGGIQARNFIKKRLHLRFFPRKFKKFLRTPILKNICKWLLLRILCKTLSMSKFHNIVILQRMNGLNLLHLDLPLTIVIRNGKIVWKEVWMEFYLRLNLRYLPKILVPRLLQHTSNVNIQYTGKSECSKQLYHLYETSFLQHWYNYVIYGCSSAITTPGVPLYRRLTLEGNVMAVITQDRVIDEFLKRKLKTELCVLLDYSY